MLELGVKTLTAYLLGALLGSLVLGRLRGVDIRSLGSGNAGATNALRTQGKLFALSVFVIDVGKGVLAVVYLPRAVLPGIAIDAGLSREWLTLACGFAVIAGHVYPVWFAFRGGKGVATMVGVIGGLDPHLLPPVIASMLAGAALVAVVFWFEPKDVPLLTFCLATELFVVFTHRSNIARMYAGKENRVRRLWLFRSRTA